MKTVMLAFLTIFMYGFIFSHAVQAAQFPIAELDNCRDAHECYLYCEIPANHESCMKYVGGQVLAESTTSPYTFPIADLGNCGSAQECSTFCSKPENRLTCYNWAVKNGRIKPAVPTTGITPALDQQKIIADAKNILGCEYPTGCKEFCSKAENHQQCAEFGRKEGLYRSSENKSSVPPANSSLKSILPDCAKAENREKCMAYACSSFCREHTDLCRGGMMTAPMSGTPEKAPPPGSTLKILQEKTGCQTPQDCSNYCREHQDICKSIMRELAPQSGTINSTHPLITPRPLTTDAPEQPEP